MVTEHVITPQIVVYAMTVQDITLQVTGGLCVKPKVVQVSTSRAVDMVNVFKASVNAIRYSLHYIPETLHK